MIGAGWHGRFIGLLLLGCAAMAWIALRTERRIPAAANGVLPAQAPATGQVPDTVQATTLHDVAAR